MSRRQKLNAEIDKTILDDINSERTWQLFTALSILHVSNNQNGLDITSRHIKYVEFIKSAINTTNKIVPFKKAKSYHLEVQNIPEIYERMKELGITPPRDTRTLDNILNVMPEAFESTLIRTTFELIGSVYQRYDEFYYVNLSFRKLNNKYLDNITKIIEKKLNIQIKKGKQPNIIISQENIPTFKELIYGNKNSYILEVKKKKLEINNYEVNKNNLERIKKIELAKEIMLKRKEEKFKLADIGSEVGYNNYRTFVLAFFKVEGINPLQWTYKHALPTYR